MGEVKSIDINNYNREYNFLKTLLNDIKIFKDKGYFNG